VKKDQGKKRPPNACDLDLVLRTVQGSPLNQETESFTQVIDSPVRRVGTKSLMNPNAEERKGVGGKVSPRKKGVGFSRQRLVARLATVLTSCGETHLKSDRKATAKVGGQQGKDRWDRRMKKTNAGEVLNARVIAPETFAESPEAHQFDGTREKEKKKTNCPEPCRDPSKARGPDKNWKGRLNGLHPKRANRRA